MIVLLRQLFGDVVITPGVLSELSRVPGEDRRSLK